MAPFEEKQIYENGIFLKTRYIGRNYSYYKRIICFTKGFTAGFLLNSSLKAFKTGSDLRSFSRMLLCRKGTPVMDTEIVLQGFFPSLYLNYLYREISFNIENMIT